MTILIICHSHSGKTRDVVKKIHDRIGGELIDIKPEKPYSSLTLYTKGSYRAINCLKDPVIPSSIDISGYDLVVIASPVWAGKPTPIINGAIYALSCCQGKKVYAIMTCKDINSGGQAITVLKAALKERGLIITGDTVLDKKSVEDNTAIDNLISTISLAGETA
jgi:flavodoxin